MPTGRAFLALGALLVASPAVASLQFDAEFSLPAHSETIAVDGHSVPCLADMNDDGELDLLVGEGSGLFPGRVRLYLNEGLPGPPSFGDWTYVETTEGELSYPGG
ncbi:MAG: hypothetical protein R3C71_04545 [Candidatus Krumholzibacteriia bacterium]|nr:hypothetical protein [Candidatus Latescibacterota bacterium]MCB9514578.1 hypothetical protein [Candidatus Latescibacterota bacterium]